MADTEKVTLNLGAVDLGRIDLLADQGFYSNRTDFIRSAIRRELDLNREAVDKAAEREAAVVGLVVYSRKMLEALAAKKQTVDLTVVGALHFDDDVAPELVRRVIRRVRLYGVLRASDPVKQALADRMA